MSDARRPENWSQLTSLIDVLLDAPPERRAELIAELSAGDPARRSEIEQLLKECEQDAGLLSHSAPDVFAGLFDDEILPFPVGLASRYRQTRELGRGGMATVYLAHDLKHRRDVAVKVVHPRLTSALGADRFLREIEIVAQLQHPHIVPLFDSGEADGSLYYVMPYEAGLSVRDRVSRNGPVPLEDVVLILRDVCDALAHAHERGVVHRDIKPDNVLLSGRHAMVADFGVAKAATDATAGRTDTVSGIPLGTPAYMAPEQIEGRAQIDHRADIYSVGVLGYELLAGRPPFVGATREEILSGHLEGEPPPLTNYRADVPAPLAELVMKSLQKDPADRWQSAEEMVARLDDIGSMRGALNARGYSTFRIWQSWPVVAASAFVVVATAGIVLWQSISASGTSWRDRWNGARIEKLTDFPGSEVDPAISGDGRFVTFLSDRDSVFDAMVMRIGGEQFRNLTGGRFPQLFNEDVRNVGFTGDGSHVWFRVADINSPASVSLVPIDGGPSTPFLETAVMATWSRNGKIAYHETTPTDPIFVADSGGRNARRIFFSDPGIHNHYLAWSPDERFIYFSRGFPPDDMDIWRVPSGGGSAERITTHNSRVAYPVLLDSRTLVYTATADDGTGPWLYMTDVEDRVPHRVVDGVEHYISISAADGHPDGARRLVASVSNPRVRLVSVPITRGVADESMTTALTLPTARGAAPRFGTDSSLWYLASRSGADGLWNLSGEKASELWKATRGAVVGAAAISPDGKRVCFPVRRSGRSTLYCTAADATDARAMAEELDVRGAPSWSPDGKWIVIAAEQAKGPRLFRISADGGTPVQLVDSVSSNPVWSPDGKFILYSGTPRARSAPLKAITPEGKPVPLPQLVVDRVGDSYRFLPGGAQLVVKQGGFRRQDFWLFDIRTGERRQLTRLNPGESVRRFDVSPDGKRIVFERVQENSDVVLIELPPR